jgi:hypothetical protein
MGAILLQEGEIQEKPQQKPGKPHLHPVAYFLAIFTAIE